MKEIYQKLMDEAIHDIEVAENHFNYADKDYVDIAILELTTARKKLDVVIEKMKEDNLFES